LAALALFNSKLANWWFVKTFGILMEVGGFKVGKIPLPSNWSAGKERLADLANKRIALGTDLDLTNGSELPMPVLKVETAIDDYVYDLFELSSHQRQLIETYAASI
jgi:hypothetical protein